VPIVESVSAFAFSFVSGDRVDLLFRLVMDHTSDHSKKILRLLEGCNRKAWRALEVALAGESLWTSLDRTETRALRDQIRKFLAAVELPGVNDRAQFRAACLTDLREALSKGVLLGNLVTGELAEKAGHFARFSDHQALVRAEKDALVRLGQEVQAAGFQALGWLLAQPAQADQSVVAVAVGYFFRREVERSPELFRGLQMSAMENLGQAQKDGFEGLEESFAASEERLTEALEEATAAVLGRIDAVHGDVKVVQEDVRQTREDVQGVWDSVENVHGSVREVKEGVEKIHGAVEAATAAAAAARGAAEAHAADTARRLDELQNRMAQLLDKLDMKNQPVAPAHSLSIRNDVERERVRELLGQLRTLPNTAWVARPGLVTEVGKLQIAVGDFSDAGESFAAAAALATTDAERAEAHHNAYRAKLEQEDFPAALDELRTAVFLDPARFAPFPLERYLPDRILGAGGFGVTFRCRHAVSGGTVAIKAINDTDLDRDVQHVFEEARTLEALSARHKAIIGIRDCGYADPTRRRRPYLVMEHFDGPTLKEYVETHGRIPLTELLPLAKTLAEALKAAHDQGVLHRDIKPANVMVRRDPNAPTGWDVRLIDFGLAMKSEVLRSSLSTRRGATIQGTSIAGTLDYAAPEQMGQLPGVKVGPPADAYGFAKTLCFALFKTPRPSMKHYGSLPKNMANLIDSSLVDDPAERPQGFAEVLKVLNKVDPDDALPMAAEEDEPPRLRRPPPRPVAESPWAKVKSGVSELLGLKPVAPPPRPGGPRPGSGSQPRPESRPAGAPKSGSGPRPRPADREPPPRPAPQAAPAPQAPPVARPAPPAPARPMPVVPVEEAVPVLGQSESPRPAPRPGSRSDTRPAGRPRDRRPPQTDGGGDRTIHAIVAILVGGFGVHKFMQGNSGNGTLRLILGLVTCLLVTPVISLIEGIQYLSMTDEQYARDYLRDKKDWF
jgi:serine/threonine protein kinase